MKERRRITVSGIVQGVGFRPFVYMLATRCGLVGQVANSSEGVVIDVVGETAVLDKFISALGTEKPPLAVVEQINCQIVPSVTNGRTPSQFQIAKSDPTARKNTLVPPDVATCAECLRELFDPNDRRYRYSFINCTNCGPRYTIIQDVPYDRPSTTMSRFRMCPECLAEYEDPVNRRFHAQPNACPVCGPQLRWAVCDTGLKAKTGKWISDPLEAAQDALADGAIVAVKGLGGYHLACDATNEAAVQTLRTRKRRPGKPFALMAANLAAVRAVCDVSAVEETLLCSAERPIVLLRRKPDAALTSVVAPNQNTLGIMLPYTPLHHLLFADAPFKWLVMTSGNNSDEPIVYQNDEVMPRLGHIADAVLSHDRPIYIRCDDSVARIVENRPQLVRRARGFAPRPLTLGFEFARPTLAVGGHLKNAFCLGQGQRAFVSTHVGNLDNVETLAAFQESIRHYQYLFDIQPGVIAHDMHPGYLSTAYALEQRGATAVAVQHHHAHIGSVMAEHGLERPLIGFAFDGTGYGVAGTVWGGEVMIADLTQFERVASLHPVALPGGEQAVKQPWRMAVSWLRASYGDAWRDRCPPHLLAQDEAALSLLEQMIDKGINAPMTTSMGRLFDAVAALLGVCQTVTFEGEAAMALEALADDSVVESAEICLRWPLLDPTPLFDALLADIAANLSPAVIAARFHNGVADVITAAAVALRNEYGINQVALSGGVFQNQRLLRRATTALQKEQFEVYTNQQVPPNDGGLALGQAAIANAKLKEQLCV